MLRRVALIVVVDELDLASEQAALGVGFLDPEAMGEGGRLAVAGEAAAERQGIADADRPVARLRARPSRQRSRGKSRRPKHRIGVASPVASISSIRFRSAPRARVLHRS